MSDETKTEIKKPWPFGDEQRRMAAEIAANAIRGLKINLDRPTLQADYCDLTKLKDYALFIESMERLSRTPDMGAINNMIDDAKLMLKNIMGGMGGTGSQFIGGIPGFDPSGNKDGN